MRRLEATDYYTISGRGLVFSMKEPDPPLELGEEVEMMMPFKGTVAGLERHPIAGPPQPGRAVGVQMNFADADDDG